MAIDRPLPGLREEEPISRLSTPVHRISAPQMSSNYDRRKKLAHQMQMMVLKLLNPS